MGVADAVDDDHDAHGLESFDQIRAIDARLPVVVLTGSDDEDLALEDSEKDDADFSDHQRKSMAEYDNDASDERKQQQDILELLNAKQEHRLLVCGRWTVLLLFIAIAGVTGWLIHNSITQQQRQEMEEDVSVLIWLL